MPASSLQSSLLGLSLCQGRLQGLVLGVQPQEGLAGLGMYRLLLQVQAQSIEGRYVLDERSLDAHASTG